MLDKKPKRKATGIIGASIAAIILAAAGAILLNRQYIIDQINYWTFTPSAEIASFAEKSSMSSTGKFLFYAAHPSLEDRNAFNQSCPSYSSSIAILGCYDGQKIYIYNITDPKLNGIREETAAYEMLHAAYKRLSPSDRKTVDGLLEAEYAKQKTSDTEASVQYFAKYEPKERDNELFSLIATQFRSIDPALEKYYSRYFNNRQQLVNLYSQYSSVFTNLQNQSRTLYTEINQLNAKIKSDSADYNQKSQQLQADVNAFNANAQSGQMTQSQYNAQRASLNSRIAALEAERSSINDEIKVFNDKINQYNALNVQFQKLNESINSSLSPAPSL